MTAHIHAFTPGLLASSSAVTVTLLAPVARLSLRAREAELPALSTALGIELPTRVGARAASGTTEVLCLGPDEWQILAAEADAPGLIAACAGVYDQAPHSLTEITDREISVQIEGPKAADLLTLGCPRDIDRLSEGEGRRTLLDGSTVVLWRDGADRFRVDIWRSFAPHVLSLLETGCAELAMD
ncbi:sarcosine oxidase subunit gamma [Roseibium salinum]|uniref:Sarcosine oxidase subunit gamma family protein n=1 Tax=Roseibium salinum TaxID=1604349 RepID=A0ABT3R8D3_9HYPH|nr:sarcosine oxidase subunit gamma family protein [Roseibium sp. DSM 29163]MCX2725258.1 sarcosine oxidase subunit gamma family protein [Roseibium sp. DSM 29163]MDN3720879.1 sarcosine oxidase subunit gamma family protein [Roseibium salinum]